MNVLIVSKTQMNPGCCVGGLILENNRSVRLLPKTGHNQPVNTPFEIGQVWDLQLEEVGETRPPHTEDIRVLKSVYVESVSNLSSFLMKRVPIFLPNPKQLFDGLIRFTSNGSGYICDRW